MEQLAVMKKAELSGTKPYAMAVIMFGCKKMFLDAASAFNNCGSSGSISHSVVMLEFEARFIVDSGFAQRDSGLFVPGREL